MINAIAGRTSLGLTSSVCCRTSLAHGGLSHMEHYGAPGYLGGRMRKEYNLLE